MRREEEKLEWVEMRSRMDEMLSALEEIRNGMGDKVFTTEKLCDYLGVGKSVIENYRRHGELPYSKLGRTYLYAKKDVDQLLARNKVMYV